MWGSEGFLVLRLGRTLCSMEPLLSLAQACSKAYSPRVWGLSSAAGSSMSPSPQGVYYRPVGISSWKHHCLVSSLEPMVVGPAGWQTLQKLSTGYLGSVVCCPYPSQDPGPWVSAPGCRTHHQPTPPWYLSRESRETATLMTRKNSIWSTRKRS